ncbi:MAG TPA: hypothetical protein VGJ48_21070 [Pyrinomonadaceae bacterium]|jgi:hypothetical protein
MIDSQPVLLVEPKRSVGLKVLAGISALVITALVFTGYALLRKRHAQGSAGVVVSSPGTAQRKPPKALVMVDDALLQGSKTIIGGTVRNTSTEKLEGLALELELMRRKDGVPEKQLVALAPAQLEPEQEGRYSLELKAQDYGSARLVGLKAGPDLVSLPYTTARGQKRLPERLESKTITIGKPPSKGGEFLNSPDKPARVP